MAFTRDTYGHLLLKRGREVAASFDRLLADSLGVTPETFCDRVVIDRILRYQLKSYRNSDVMGPSCAGSVM